MNNKVYIITFFNELNYGAALQSYAMQSKLKKLGAKPEFLGVKLCSFAPDKEKNIKKTAYDIISKLINSPKIKSFKNFRDNEIPVVYEGFTYERLIKENVDCDVVVCGSDQIWNPNLTYGLQPYYFGQGINCKKRISYAASCGNTQVLAGKEEELKKLLASFDKVSVREDQLKEYFDENEIASSVVTDPTLLIDDTEWIALAKKSSVKNKLPSKYIFVYDLEGTAQFKGVVDSFAKEKRLPVVSLRNKSHYLNDDVRFPAASPYDFLELILNAEYVVSNSYHAMIFSYIFKKKLCLVPHSKYSQRMSAFLNTAGESLGNEAVKILDFLKISGKSNVEEEIEKSELFLKDALEL